MPMIGADLAAMDALARRFDLAGTAFRAESQALVDRATDALDAFTAELARFGGEARALDAEIGTAVGRLRSQADATEWTGIHRQGQEHALVALEHDVLGVRGAIEGLVEESRHVVNGTLAARLGDTQRQVAAAGDRAELIATSFARAVAHQRQAFDLVLNG